VEALGRAGVRKVAFSGGEPLLRTDLEEVMGRGRQAGITGFGLVTNGALLEPARARSLKAAGLGSAQVSLDGPDARDHAVVRGGTPRDFYRAQRAVRLFRDAGVMVQVAALVSPLTIQRFDELVLLTQALGAAALRFCSFVPAGRGQDPAVRSVLEPSPDQLRTFVDRLRAARESLGRALTLTVDHGIGPWRADGQFTCGAGRDVAYLAADGTLYPCPGLFFDAFRVGNTRETPLADLLDSPLMSTTRSLPKTDLEGPCSTCTNTACSGGCRGAAFACTGRVTGSPAFCVVCEPTPAARRGD
jgi:radical SAM protein with 4Fe4S-binding SPASM domain